MERDARFQSLLLHISRCPLQTRSRDKSLTFFRVPGKGAPVHGPQRGPYGDRCPVSRASSLIIHSYISQCPQLSSTNRAKTYGHRPRSPTRTEGLHTIGCSVVPQGDRLRHCCYYPIAMQNSARYLEPWLGCTIAPLASTCHSKPLQVSPPHLLPPPSDPRYGSPPNPEVQTRGWIYGRQRCLVTKILAVAPLTQLVA